MNKTKLLSHLADILLGAAIILVLAFIVNIGIDFYNYDKILNSAPFYVFVLAHSISFLTPAIILFIISKIIKHKPKK